MPLVLGVLLVKVITSFGGKLPKPSYFLFINVMLGDVPFWVRSQFFDKIALFFSYFEVVFLRVATNGCISTNAVILSSKLPNPAHIFKFPHFQIFKFSNPPKQKSQEISSWLFMNTTNKKQGLDTTLAMLLFTYV